MYIYGHTLHGQKHLFQANAIIVVGMEASVFLNAFRSNRREKKNKRIPLTRGGKTVLYITRTCNLKGRSSIALFKLLPRFTKRHFSKLEVILFQEATDD